ncbi:MAG TPA: ABC transporter permease [Steroidobacteraceae bacterium]|jgi:ABC-2 type transport system permease protein|nr:ABC transporter permease [Steroidobacteraceae bacterium]
MRDGLAKWWRIWALTRKETRQILRDPSSIAIGIVFPLMMILLFGYGLSLDVTKVSVAVVDQEGSANSAGLIGAFRLSPYFKLQAARSIAEATTLMLDRKVDGILQIPSDYSRRWHSGVAEIQILVDGTDANQARIMQGYAEGPVSLWSAAQQEAGAPVAVGPTIVVSRLWFNEANDSHYFIVPGLIVLVMTIIGAFLTAMVVAREWERGTLEALFVTPMRPGEFLISKFVPYFGLGMIGFVLCLLAGQFLFHVPLRGSLSLLCFTSMVYLVVALGIGLLVSTLVKSQFLASQLAMLLTFLPAMMLSGFLYDLRSMPAFIRAITYALPARYAVALLQTLYLAGNVGGVIWLNLSVLAAMAAGLVLAARLATRKQIT